MPISAVDPQAVLMLASMYVWRTDRHVSSEAVFTDKHSTKVTEGRQKQFDLNIHAAVFPQSASERSRIQLGYPCEWRSWY